MALETTGGAPASRKIRRLGIAVVIVVALYSAGWFFVASKFEDFISTHLGGAGPVDMDCPGLATSGFPFLIGFTCDRTEIGDRTTGNSLTAGALRAAARIYSPGSAVVELDGPANVSLSDGSALTVWARGAAVRCRAFPSGRRAAGGSRRRQRAAPGPAPVPAGRCGARLRRALVRWLARIRPPVPPAPAPKPRRARR